MNKRFFWIKLGMEKPLAISIFNATPKLGHFVLIKPIYFLYFL